VVKVQSSKIIRARDLKIADVQGFSMLCAKKVTSEQRSAEVASEVLEAVQSNVRETLFAETASINMLESERLRAWEQRLIEKEKDLLSKEQTILMVAEEAGLKAGYREGWECSQQERVLLKKCAESFEAKFNEIESKLAPLVVELAVHAARHIVHESCSINLEKTPENIKSVIAQFKLNSKEIEIVANSRTIAAIRNHDVKDTIFSRFTFTPDESLEDMGFILRHDDGAYDSTIETRWVRAIGQLSETENYRSNKEIPSYPEYVKSIVEDKS
tara:strand:+ start:10492 stop:11307 length:816 start_codon:yes stop_codon:yes gene_type:complete